MMDTRRQTQIMAVRAAVLWAACSGMVVNAAQHYVFLNRDRARIDDSSFLQTRALAGAQVKYTWRELEPEQDSYDFRPIAEDLRRLTSNGKKLFVQLQDVSFDASINNVPQYLMREPRFHGGAVQAYDIPHDDEQKAVAAGWVARRWDPAVQERFQRLVTALGKEFDGRIAGINLPETAVSFGESGRLFPSGFTFERYRDAIVTNMAALKRAFPKSVVMQYANFMPGEWRPQNDKGFLRSVYERARALGVGLGGPDLMPYRRAQMNHAYGLLRESSGMAPTGIAVQWGNYEFENPQTGKRVTIPELVNFATEYLKVDYLFWSTQEPFYTEQVIPFLKRMK